MFGSGGGGTGGAGGGVLTLEITDVLVVEGEMEWNLLDQVYFSSQSADVSTDASADCRPTVGHSRSTVD